MELTSLKDDPKGAYVGIYDHSTQVFTGINIETTSLR